MKGLILILCLIGIASSCGIELEGLDAVKDANVTVDMPEGVLEPDYEAMATFCDDRYLPDYYAAEECFEDLRRYFKIEVGPDFDAITEYCASTYEVEAEAEACQEELLNFMDFGEVDEE